MFTKSFYMRSIVFVLTLLVFSHLLMSSSCSKTHNPEGDCAGVACTAMFAMVSVQVTDANGQPVALDDAYTVASKTGEKIKVEQPIGAGQYVVIDDSYRQKLMNRTDDFRFIGMKNGVIVVDQAYRISADCCHVSKVSGPEAVTIK
jgi:hypothetical protein